jgi:hypothetical protein
MARRVASFSAWPAERESVAVGSPLRGRGQLDMSPLLVHANDPQFGERAQRRMVEPFPRNQAKNTPLQTARIPAHRAPLTGPSGVHTAGLHQCAIACPPFRQQIQGRGEPGDCHAAVGAIECTWSLRLAHTM